MLGFAGFRGCGGTEGHLSARIEADRRKSRTSERRAEWSSHNSEWFDRAFEARDENVACDLDAIKEGIRLAIRTLYETTHETVLEPPPSSPADQLPVEVMGIPAEEDMPF